MKIPCRNPQSAATDTTTCNKTKRYTASPRGAFRARRLLSPSRRRASSVLPVPDSKKAAHTGVWRPCRTVRPDTSFLGRHDHPATWAFAPPARSSRTERAAQVSGAHLLNLSLTESLISEAFSLVLSHIELSDEEPSLVMVSVGWAGVVPFMDAPSVEPCS